MCENLLLLKEGAMTSYQRYLPGYSLHRQVPKEKKKATMKHNKAIK